MADLTPYIKSRTAEAMDAAWSDAQTPRHSRRLGGSAIGAECTRAIWYQFRWAYPPERFDGRMLRLFETGNVYEDRLVADLRRAGMTVTGTQDEATSIGGHFVAKIDGRVTRVPDAPKTEHLLECKSHNDKSFKALKKDGVAKSKPAHMAQMQSYMHVHGLTRALYVAVNKNDDEVHAERVDYDLPAAVALMTRAESVICSDRAPPKLHDDPTSKAAWACNYCPARGVCHDGRFAERSCRTCLHATALIDGVDGAWSCARWAKLLTPAEVEQGCAKHLYLPDLVPGAQVDADTETETVTYQMPNGTTFVDGGAR